MEIARRVCFLLVAAMIAVFYAGNSFGQESQVNTTDTARFKPYVVFSLGGGVTRFMGDVQDASEKANVHLIGNRAAFDLNVGVALSKSFVVNVNGVYGKLSGNENTFGLHRNFETQFVLAGLNAEYNFGGLWKKRIPVLNPFITAGAYYGNYFNVSTDVLYGDSQEYYYWPNGIYDRSQDDPNSDDKNPISRDYEYETKLTNGSQHTFTAGVGFGLDLHLSKALSLRLMSRYFHALNDKVDGYGESGISNMKDGYFFNQLSLVVSTAAFGKNKNAEPVYKYLFDVTQLKSVEEEDQDGDGVLDLDDKCANTPDSVKVDKAGCPLDSDKDGIADYKDMNPNTAEGEIVNTKGAPVNYDLVEDRWINYQGARIISWDKDYKNPRFMEEASYAVTYAVVKGEEIDEASLLKTYPKLIRKELTDSLVVFNMGTYEKFENAQQASLRTHKTFSHDVVVVNENYINKVASDLSGIKIPDSIANKGSYGIAESIERIKQTDANTFPQLEYTISRFEGHLEDGVPESVLVEPYLRGIAPFTWNQSVKESYIEVNEVLKENPVAKIPLSIVLEETTSPVVEPKEVAVATSNVAKDEGSEEGVNDEEKLVAEFNLSKNAKLEFMPTTEKFKIADLNEDGLIHHKEIEKVLANIIEGNSLMLVKEFNDMTKLFTDFTENTDPIDFGGTTAAYVDGKLVIFKPQNTELKLDARRLLAAKYKDADYNGDGDLAPDEVQTLIANFMEGKTEYSSDKIYELIDLYFE